jgi:hypothetical protein
MTTENRLEYPSALEIIEDFKARSLALFTKLHGLEASYDGKHNWLNGSCQMAMAMEIAHLRYELSLLKEASEATK